LGTDLNVESSISATNTLCDKAERLRIEFDKFSKVLEREEREENMTDEAWEGHCFRVLGSERKSMEAPGPDGKVVKRSWSDVIWASAGLPHTKKGNKESSWSAFRALALRYNLSWQAIKNLMRAYESAKIPHPYKEEKMEALREIVRKRKSATCEAALERDITYVMKARPPTHPIEIPKHYQIHWIHEAGLSDLITAVEWLKRDTIDIKKNVLQELYGISHVRWTAKKVRSVYLFTVNAFSCHHHTFGGRWKRKVFLAQAVRS
jgi:hypothetical protein